MIDYKKIGLKIKENRKKLKLTQKELGEKIEKTKSSIQKYEKGLTQIPNDVLEKLADVFQMSVFELLSENRQISIADFKENLKKIRKAKNVTQNQLAFLIGKTRLTIARYENGEINPSLKIIKRIADALDVSLDALISDKDREMINFLESVSLDSSMKRGNKMRFIRVKFASEQYLVNPLKITKLCLDEKSITIWFGDNDPMEIFNFECTNFKEVREQILKNL